MKYSSILSIAAVVMIWPVAATAAPPQLKGTYAVTGTVQCLNSNLPFNANFTPAIGSFVQSNRATFVGTDTFDGNGSGQMTVRSVGMNLPPGTPLLGINASASNVTAVLTYTFDASGGVSINIVPGTYLLTNLTGPGVGGTSTIDTLPLYGMASNDNKMIVLATPTTVMDTEINTPPGGGVGNTRYRLCHRSEVLIWIVNER
jgi:hypothetical protein